MQAIDQSCVKCVACIFHLSHGWQLPRVQVLHTLMATVHSLAIAHMACNSLQFMWMAAATETSSHLYGKNQYSMNSAGLNKERNQETKKPRNKQRHSMKFKRPCLQHWANNE